MKKLLQTFFTTSGLFICLIILSTLQAQAQSKNGSVTGKVTNGSDKTPLDFATVVVRDLKDSSVVATTTTETNGTFLIKSLAMGNYKLYIAFLGLKTATRDFSLTADKPAANIGEVVMDQDGVNLKTVEVKGEVAPVIVKTDTVEFNAKSFKVRENAVAEDLLKKLPGVEVAKDGTVKAQGETVTKVKVDGKEFFGNDPLIATRNIPAELIDKIQVIDEQSEQSRFTGVDDGNRNKVINITTKNGLKKGYFANANAGYGEDDRYDGKVFVNTFNDDQKITLVGQFNNVNKQDFGNMGGFGGGGGGGIRFSGRGGGGANQPGITTTNAVGLNFQDLYKDGTELSGNYFFNKTDFINNQNTLQTNLLGNATSTFRNRSDNTSGRENHRFNFLIDTRLDSATSIRIQPNLSFTRDENSNLSNYVRNYNTLNTVGEQRLTSNSTSPVVSNNILIRRKFLRRGRTLSLNINTNINDNSGDNFNYILDNNTVDGTTLQKLTDQLNDSKSNSLSNTARVVYTEPLSKVASLEFNFQNGYNQDLSERYAYDYNPATLSYDLLNTTYSNVFENTTLTNALGMSYNVIQKKYTWNLGLAVQNTDRKNINKTLNSTINQNFYNLTPTAQFRYNFSRSKRLQIDYRGNTSQPGINQIQPIVDNTNTTTLPVGNPDLRPSFTNNLRLRFNNFDFTRFRTLFAFINLSQTSNAFSSERVQITNPADTNFGKIRVRTINVDGVYSGNAFANLGLPIIPNNKLNLNININGNYQRDVDFNTAIKNISNTWSITNGYSLVSNMDKFDVNAGIRGTLNRSTYSAQPGQNNTYYTLNPTVDISYLFPGNVRLALDIDYFQNTGRGPGFDNRYTIVNSYLSKQAFKNRGTFKVSVNDALNQNQGVTRTSTSSTITDSNFLVLKRFYMLTFTYNLNRVGGRTVDNDSQQQGMPGMGGGMRRGGF
ncbi:hypothetical protein C7T94_00500 [Pedobacter yulinensis]|uniref:Outer membrane protein beta-barrel domain-containing protein n=1 Tax=Pedobacter yulinensis TaxID=2126353 RepID=A0A2T3HQE6_9SPHI|nr:TonB-dependent receptor [Pedobacter yulinensis]PST84649.1 hypothetical protein C7T94_00500 [Pedobacter yulinensis]